MRKVLIIILALLLACSMTACAFSKQSKNNTVPEQPSQEPADTEGAEKKKFTSWNEVPKNTYREETITVDYNGQKIWGVAYIPELDKEMYPLVICSHGLGGSYTSCMEYA